ncbi:MAG: response regulator [Chloroflexota bacterium]
MQASDLRVLVIEDEEDSALMIGSALTYSGAQIWSAHSGEEGLELLGTVSPNLMLVDLSLPGIDGWTFLDRVRNNPKTSSIPAIVVSAYLTPTVAQKALQAGFSACFPKPIDTTSLVRQLVSILS